MNKKYDPSFDEALLEHFDDMGYHHSYQVTLNRMRAQGYEPRGRAAPWAAPRAAPRAAPWAAPRAPQERHPTGSREDE